MLRAKLVWSVSLLIVIGATLFSCVPNAAVSLSPASYVCDDPNPAERSTVQSVSLDVLQKLGSGQAETVWESGHPTLKEATPKAQFLEASKTIQPRLTNAAQSELKDDKVIKVASPGNAPVQAICGSIDVSSPDHLRVIVPARANSIAISLVELPGASIDRTASVLLQEDQGQLRLTSLFVSPTRYKSRDSAYYTGLGEKWTASGHMLSGLVAYKMASALTSLGPLVQSGHNVRIGERIGALAGNSGLQNELKTWTADNTSYQIIDVGLIETLSELSLDIKYLAHQETGPNTTPKEASSLMRHLQDRYPELKEATDGVLFEAYNEVPSDPTRTYAGYRVALMFE